MTLHINAKTKLISMFVMASLSFAAHAEVPEQAVQLSNVRDAALMPYEHVHALLAKVASAGSNRVQVAFRVVSKKSETPVPDLEVGLRGDHTFEILRVTPSGFVEVPLSDTALADRADFVTNQKRGTLQLDYFLVPKLPERRLKYGDLIQSIDGVRRVRRYLTPWYLRPLMESTRNIGICYPDNRQSVTISHSRDTVRLANTERVSTLTKQKVYCAEFSAKETRIPEYAIINAPDGWHLLYQ